MSNLTDERRLPFFIVTKPASAALGAHFTGRRLPVARSIYFAIVELANDARSETFEKPRKAIASRAGVNVSVVDDYVPEIEACGILRVERLKVEGHNLPNRWTLLDPPPGGEGGGAGRPPLDEAHEGGGAEPLGVAVQDGQGGGAAGGLTQELEEELKEPPTAPPALRVVGEPDLVEDVESGPAGDGPPPLPSPPPTVNRRRVTEAEWAIASAAHAEMNRQCAKVGVGPFKLTTHLRKYVMRIRENPELTADDHVAIVAAKFARDAWWAKRGGTPSPSVIYGQGDVFEGAIATWRAKPPPVSDAEPDYRERRAGALGRLMGGTA
jgi:hypothetical protein